MVGREFGVPQAYLLRFLFVWLPGCGVCFCHGMAIIVCGGKCRHVALGG